MVTIVLIEVVILLMVFGLHPRMENLSGGTGMSFQGHRESSHPLTCTNDHFSISKGVCENAHQMWPSK